VVAWSARWSPNRAAGIVLIVLGFGLALYLAWRLPAPILVWIAALGIAEAAAERERGAAIASLSRGKAALWLGAYLAIGAAAVGLLLVGAAIKGDSAVLDLLRSLWRGRGAPATGRRTPAAPAQAANSRAGSPPWRTRWAALPPLQRGLRRGRELCPEAAFARLLRDTWLPQGKA
jgi:hypothetical protein